MKNKSADGLRGLAAFNVVVSHFLAAFLPAMLHNCYPDVFAKNANPSTLFNVLTFPPLTIFYNGHFAVFLFFVLSGYVLTLPYYTQEDPARSLGKRLWGRYIRLNLPIAAAIALSYILYRAGLYHNVQAAEISGSTHWLNNYFLPGLNIAIALKESIYQSILFGSGTFVPPLWTLRVEFIGSLYILLFYIAKPRRFLLIPLLLAVCLVYAVHGQDSVFFLAIFLGSLLSRIKATGGLKFLYFAIGVYFGGFQFESPIYDFLPRIGWGDVQIWEPKDFYNLVGAFFMTAAIVHGFGATIFQGRIAQFLARISYSIYLIHFAVLCSVACAMRVWLPFGMTSLVVIFAGYVLVCFGVSILFEKWIDRPAINLSHRFTTWLYEG